MDVFFFVTNAIIFFWTASYLIHEEDGGLRFLWSLGAGLNFCSMVLNGSEVIYRGLTNV